MSKSLGNCIYLSDTEAEVKQKVMNMFTDPNHLKVSDPGSLEGNAVFTYLDAFCQDEHFAAFLPEYANLDELKAHYQRGRFGGCEGQKIPEQHPSGGAGAHPGAQGPVAKRISPASMKS